jgi:hypothetical protein
MSNLPILRADILSEETRRELALQDLQYIEAEATVQNAVNDYALDRSLELTRSQSVDAAPEDAKELFDVFKQVCLEGVDLSAVNLKKLAQSKVLPKSPLDGIDPKTLKKALAALHPDRSAGATTDAEDSLDETIATGDMASDEELYKIMSNARDEGDELTTQGLAAQTIASKAVSDRDRPVEELETERWKAHLALRASEGRFSTTEEVDAWFERELEVAPYRVRGAMLGQLQAIFIKMLNPDEDGRIFLSGPDAEDTAANIREVGKRVKWLTDEEQGMQVFQQIPDGGIEEFDSRFKSAFKTISKYLGGGYKRHGYLGEFITFDFSRELVRLSRTLETRQERMGRMVLSMPPRPGTISPSAPSGFGSMSKESPYEEGGLGQIIMNENSANKY